MSEFRKLSMIAKDIEDVLKASNIFRDVRRATVTSHEQMIKLIPSLATLPAAVVCMGPAKTDDDQATRDLSPGIVVVDCFDARVSDRADSIWDLVEAAANLFIPEDIMDPPIIINDVIYTVESFDPVTLAKSDNSAYLIGLKADYSR